MSDGLGAFISAAEQFAEAANRLIGDTVFNLLTSASGTGPTMSEDSLPLFLTTHTSGANYIASTGAPDATGIGALSLLMRKQKGFVRPLDTAPTLNIVPRYLLSPASLAAQSQITLASLASPESEDGDDPAIVTAPKLLVEPRLDAATNGATAWYLVSTDCPGLELPEWHCSAGNYVAAWRPHGILCERGTGLRLCIHRAPRLGADEGCVINTLLNFSRLACREPL